MKPGRLAQCLPVVSATGIERTDLLRPGRPAQWVSRSTRSPGIVSARWALSIPLNPPPVADATGRHSTGPSGLKAVLVLSTAVLVLQLDSTGVGLSSSTESTAHLSNDDIKCESQEIEVRRNPVGVLRATVKRRRFNCHKKREKTQKKKWPLSSGVG
ncbi:hypothetical protein Enr13x_53020 [Stieleria neptunia]|uniref:Uncharacterized protein n=1 Tax=Stieleria neptunia TaxID=2527979 RepID=A0A518HX51_9BACT|nr:hypothetical protein Enr13x_53020 [Stieleria neptunia]